MASASRLALLSGYPRIPIILHNGGIIITGDNRKRRREETAWMRPHFEHVSIRRMYETLFPLGAIRLIMHNIL